MVGRGFCHGLSLRLARRAQSGSAVPYFCRHAPSLCNAFASSLRRSAVEVCRRTRQPLARLGPNAQPDPRSDRKSNTITSRSPFAVPAGPCWAASLPSPTRPPITSICASLLNDLSTITVSHHGHEHVAFVD
ncbi:hypothetical protein L1887_48917 [Cichorium endivia]|nr:hypothetical protein L1887_48917 [Cichorium endivia]